MCKKPLLFFFFKQNQLQVRFYFLTIFVQCIFFIVMNKIKIIICFRILDCFKDIL